MGMQKTIKIDVGSTKPLWPYEVVQVLEDVMQEGERAGKSGWETRSDHVDHAYDHLVAYLNDDKSDNHLAHAFTRLMMAIAIERGYVQKGGE